MRFCRVRQIRKQRLAVESGRLAFVLHMFEHGKEPFLAVDDMFGPGKSAASKQRALGSHASRPRIDRVLHVSQLARGNRARTKCARRADAHGRYHLLPRKIQHATRRDRRRERAQSGVMPAVFTHTRPSHFAKTHFNFVSDDRGENQIFATEAFAFTECQRRSDEIARMTWIGFPIDVVVIHRADHVAIQKCGIDWIGLEPGDERRRATIGTGHRPVMFQQNLGVILPTAAQSAANGIEPKQFRCLNRRGRKMLVFQRASPLGNDV